MDNTNNNYIGFLPVVPFKGEHPDMLIKTPERDRRLDVVTYSDYSRNDESYD